MVKIKALLLLLVFASNSLISFGCSVRMDHEGKNPDHSGTHHHRDAIVHKDAYLPHSHQETGRSDHHDHHGQPGEKKEENKPGCCSDQVVDFSKLVKLLPQNHYHLPLFVQTFFDFPGFIAPEAFDKQIVSHPFIRSWPPGYHKKLRIVIQSFQI